VGAVVVPVPSGVAGGADVGGALVSDGPVSGDGLAESPGSAVLVGEGDEGDGRGVSEPTVGDGLGDVVSAVSGSGLTTRPDTIWTPPQATPTATSVAANQPSTSISVRFMLPGWQVDH
jgi:hypothetical protein